MRAGLVPFNAALIGSVEASRGDEAAKNRLCPPNPFPQTALDWLRTTHTMTRADAMWMEQPDLAGWLERSRLNVGRGRDVMRQMLRIVGAVAASLLVLAACQSAPGHGLVWPATPLAVTG